MTTKKTQKKISSKIASKSVKKVVVKKKPIEKIILGPVSTLGVVPLGDRVLVRPFAVEEVETKNAFGIIIPDTVVKEKPEQGEVVAIGEGRHEHGKSIAMKVHVGDKVIFSKYGFDDVTVCGIEYYILKEENILAIIK